MRSRRWIWALPQWRLGRLGLLSRIDVKFAPGADIAAAQRAWQLPIGLRTERAEVARDREQALSRAYRVNLTCCRWWRCSPAPSWCFHWQSQAVVARRRSSPAQDARATRAQIARMLIAEAAAFGSVGALLGLGLGALLADAALRTLGGDLVAAISPALTRASRSIRSVRCCSSLSVWAPRSVAHGCRRVKRRPSRPRPL